MAEGVDRLNCIITDLEKQMKDQLMNHPFGEWLLEQEGIGVRTAGCFLGEAGDLSRFDSEAKLARYAGNGAVFKQSGKSEGHHWDAHRYNHRLKRALILMAESRSHHHPESNLFITSRKKEKGDYWKGIKKLARYLIRFIWRAWQKIVLQDGVLSEVESKA